MHMFCMFASLSVLFGFGTWGQNGQSPQFTISRKGKQSEAIAKKKKNSRGLAQNYTIEIKISFSHETNLI